MAMPHPVLTKPTGIKEWIVCPECCRQLGQIVDGLFILKADYKGHGDRIVVGPMPAIIFCEDCGGVWANPVWDLADSPQAIWQAIQRLDCLQTPMRDWGAVPVGKRPQRFR